MGRVMLVLALMGCRSASTESYIHKGPFVADGQVRLQPLDASGTPRGPAVEVPVLDDAGRFEATVPGRGPVLVTAEGTFWDEVADAPFGESTTLRAIGSLDTAGDPLNVNLVTHITTPRIRALMAAGRPLADARTQAETELFRSLGLGSGLPDGLVATGTTLLDTDTDASWVFLVSATVLTAANRGADPASDYLDLVDALSEDLLQNGAIDVGTRDALAQAEYRMNTGPTEAALASRFAAVGEAETAPDLDIVADQDGDGLTNDVDVCAFIADDGATDFDSDGIPDACDPRWIRVAGAPSVLCGASDAPPYAYCTDIDTTVDPSWRPASGTPQPPIGDPIRSIQVSGAAACVLDENDAARCRFVPGTPETTLADDAVDVSVGGTPDNEIACVLRPDGRVRCSRGLTELPDPAGTFTDIAVGQDIGCGVRSGSGALACWRTLDGAPSVALDPLPEGAFVRVTSDGVLGRNQCALDAEGRLACFGDHVNDGDVPAGSGFVEVALSQVHGCARTDAGQVRCWGFRDACAPSEPDTPIVSLGLGACRSCGVTVPGDRICWD